MVLKLENATRKERLVTAGGSYYYVYYFNCSSCGAEIRSQHNYLARHSGLCLSCSHRKSDYSGAYGRLLYNTKTRGIPVYLTLEEFQELCKISDCHYCKIEIRRNLKSGEKGYRGYLLDRKNNELPYTRENCVPCCWSCNQAKGSRYTYEEFVLITNELKRFREEQKTAHWRDQLWFDPDEIPAFGN